MEAIFRRLNMAVTFRQLSMAVIFRQLNTAVTSRLPVNTIAFARALISANNGQTLPMLQPRHHKPRAQICHQPLFNVLLSEDGKAELTTELQPHHPHQQQRLSTTTPPC
jgi:hypothetical protein